MSFNTIRENKILAKITQVTVGLLVSLGLLDLHTIHFYDCMDLHTSWYLSLLKPIPEYPAGLLVYSLV